jgi:hypothetical protein
MAARMVAQTGAVALLTDSPRTDQLPDGWDVMNWRVTQYRDWQDEHYEIECQFVHPQSGAEVWIDLKVQDKPIDYDWLRAFLVASEGVPRGLRAVTEQRPREWWEQ